MTEDRARRIVEYIKSLNQKAYCLSATMYKGFVANGNTNVVELYEAQSKYEGTKLNNP